MKTNRFPFYVAITMMVSLAVLIYRPPVSYRFYDNYVYSSVALYVFTGGIFVGFLAFVIGLVKK